MSISSIQGQLLEVTVVDCHKLKNTEWISRQDPYVCLEYGSTKFRTRTCTDGGKNPVFQEKFVFNLIEGLREINVVVWNSNTLTYDDFIGSGKVQLQDVLSRGYDDRAWPLQTKTGRYAGEIKLIMHYANANKPAISSTPSAPPYRTPPSQPELLRYSDRPTASTCYTNPTPACPPPPPQSTPYPPSTAYPPPSQPPQSAPYPPSTVYPPPSQPPQSTPYPPSTAYPPPPTAYPPTSPYPYPPPNSAAYPPYPYPPPPDQSAYHLQYPPPPSAYPPPPYPPPPHASPYPYSGHYPGMYPPPPY